MSRSSSRKWTQKSLFYRPVGHRERSQSGCLSLRRECRIKSCIDILYDYCMIVVCKRLTFLSQPNFKIGRIPSYKRGILPLLVIWYVRQYGTFLGNLNMIFGRMKLNRNSRKEECVLTKQKEQSPSTYHTYNAVWDSCYTKL